MIHIENPSPQGLEKWASSFDPDELRRGGGSRENLLDMALSKQVFSSLSDGGTAVSVIIYHRVDLDTYEILFLGTSPRERKKGQMEQLFREFLHRNEGKKFWLECREDNEAAINLYLKLGFKETGRRPRYYRDGTTAILFNIQAPLST